MALEGVDYAFPPRPRASELARLGKRFAVRYGGPGSSDKQLDPAEANALAAAGLWIVANAEGSAQGLLGGFDVGASWARTAAAHFKACGMPDDRPIYLSIDFDVTSGQWPTVRDALSGAAHEIGLSRVGVYGGYRACQWAHRDAVATWLWQTYAWSTWQDPDGVRRLHWLPGAHLQQYRNGVPIDGADCDLNRALPADFGQWQPGHSGNYGPPGGEDMSDAYDLLNHLTRLEGSATYTPGGEDGQRYGSLPNAVGLEPSFRAAKDARIAADNTDDIKAEVAALRAEVAALSTGGIPPADLKAVLLDPDVLAAIAKAVTDEIAS
jgi:hypothetical protein